ncbi:MAG: dTMP kinase [Longimicrobiales bacterium]
MDSRGIFVALEGPEGSGKTTQAARLVDWLSACGRPHLHVREPGGLPVAEQVRRILLERAHVPAVAELMLILAARAALVEERIAPALAEGAVVVADRFELSTFAYQIHGRGLPEDAVRRANTLATGGLRPDLTLVLDVPAGVAEERRRDERRRPDRIESAGAAFHARVMEAYGLLATSEPDVELVDGSGAPDVVHERVVARLRARFPETFRVGEGFNPA